jgi:hypothetical protein
VAIALAFGLPIGIVLGRWAWTAFASNLPVPGHTTTPPALLLIIPISIAGAVALAIAPGIIAGRQAPARALRAS